ncbi:MAG: hypothetical protein E7016_01725 [Alphaproteobacteria bacterium]|nr:hypothetical protein [Alphaproteobacteria bacterium]
MVNEVGIQNDFDVLAEFTGTAAFSYNEIHNQYISTSTSYDYPRIIREVSKARGWSHEKTKQELIDAGVLVYLSNDEYAVDVHGTTRNGGGVNYNQGLVLFNFDKADSQSTYHEYAHSLQSIYETFNDNTLKQMYDNVGLDIKAESEFEKHDYTRYLKEMHADTFGFAALLLRAESLPEFLEISLRAMRRAAHMTVKGENQKNTIYGRDDSNLKYYASYNVMKKTIKEIWKIRNLKDINQYFDENGVIKFKELCKLSEDIVSQSAYSPKQFKAFKNHSLNISYTKRGIHPIDHNHKRDILNSIILLGMVTMLEAIRKKKMTKSIKAQSLAHKKLIDEYTNLQNKFVQLDIIDNVSKPLIAEQSIERLHAGIAMINHKLGFPSIGEDILRTMIHKRYKNQDFTEENRKKDIENCCMLMNIKNSQDIELLSNFLLRADAICAINIHNEYFKKIMSYSDETLYEQRDIIKTLKEKPEKLKYSHEVIRPLIEKEEPLMLLQNADKIKALIELGYDVNKQDIDGYTPLMCCMNPEKTKVLLENGADINAKDSEGNTALMQTDNKMIMQVLLEAKPNLEIKNNIGRTALMNCTNLECVELLINAGADINAQDNNGDTALILSTEQEELKTLLKAKPNLEIKNKKGKTALTSFTNAENFALLLNAGANITTKDNYGSNPLMGVLISDIPDIQKEKIVDILLDKKIEANDTNKDNENALVYVARSKKISNEFKNSLAQKLILYGVDIDSALSKIPNKNEKEIITNANQEIQKKAQRLATIRNKIAKGVDKIDEKIGSPIQKVLGKKVQDIQLPDAIKQTEAQISSKLFRR